MQRAAVVPDHEIADAPLVRVDELRLRGETIQLTEEHFALLARPPHDVGGVLADVQRRPARLRNDAHDIVASGRHRALHVVGDHGVARAAARLPEVVLGDGTVNTGLRIGRQRVPGGAGVDEHRVAALRRNDMRQQQRPLRGQHVEGAIRVELFVRLVRRVPERILRRKLPSAARFETS